MFIKAVGRGRGASQDSVRGGFGQGRMVLAADAVKIGMADRVATFDETLARLGASASNPVRMAASASRADMQDGDPEDLLEEKDCMCGCSACVAEDCMNCSNMNCSDPNCDHGSRAMSAISHLLRGLDLRSKKFSRRRG
jgi:ClpP class serine protease